MGSTELKARLLTSGPHYLYQRRSVLKLERDYCPGVQNGHLRFLSVACFSSLLHAIRADKEQSSLSHLDGAQEEGR